MSFVKLCHNPVRWILCLIQDKVTKGHTERHVFILKWRWTKFSHLILIISCVFKTCCHYKQGMDTFGPKSPVGKRDHTWIRWGSLTHNVNKAERYREVGPAERAGGRWLIHGCKRVFARSSICLASWRGHTSPVWSTQTPGTHIGKGCISMCGLARKR